MFYPKGVRVRIAARMKKKFFKLSKQQAAMPSWWRAPIKPLELRQKISLVDRIYPLAIVTTHDFQTIFGIENLYMHIHFCKQRFSIAIILPKNKPPANCSGTKVSGGIKRPQDVGLEEYQFVS